jgi:YVTN family beta-propeller protein
VSSVTGNISILAANNVTFSGTGNVTATGLVGPATGAGSGPTINVGSGPTQVAVDSVTNMIYVTNYNSGTVSVINGVTETVVATVTLVAGVNGIAVDQLTNKIYVVNQVHDTVSVIDGATDTVIATDATGTTPVGIAIDPGTNKIYIANTGSTFITVIDGATETASSISLGTDVGAAGVAVDTSSHTVYVGASTNIDESAVDEISGGVETASVLLGFVGLVNVAVDSATHIAYTADFGAGEVQVINGTTITATITLPAGSETQFVAVDAMTNKIYVTANTLGWLSVINGADNSVVNIAISDQGGGETLLPLVVDQSNDTIYIDDFYAGNLIIVAGANNAVSSVSTGGNADRLDVDTVTGVVYVPNQGVNTVYAFEGIAPGPTLAPGGTIDVVAQGGSVSQAANLEIQSNTGNIDVTAQVNLVLGTVDARAGADQAGTLTVQTTWGNVALTATTGTITDAQARGVNATNIFANGLRLEAALGIGVLGSRCRRADCDRGGDRRGGHG